MSSNAGSLQPRQGPVTSNETGTAEERGIELRRVSCFLTESLLKRVLKKLFPDQRKDERLPLPPLVGYLGTVRSSKPYELSDISASGFCMLTDEQWTPGTEMPITLQRAIDPGPDDAECFTVQATVVRCGTGDVGFSMLLSDDDSHAMFGDPVRVQWISKAEMKAFISRLKAEGTTATEEPVEIQTADRKSGAPLAPVLLPSR